jgi:hypothetical protein
MIALAGAGVYPVSRLVKSEIPRAPGAFDRRGAAMPTQSLGCPNCQGTFEADAAGGQQVVCPHCRQPVTVPTAGAGTPTWYLARDNQRYGPYLMAQLKKMTEAGQIQPNVLVWKEGMPNWVEAGSLPELFPAGPTAAPAAGGTAASPQEPGYAVTGAGALFQGGAGQFWSTAWTHLKRAFTLNLRTLAATDAEKQALTARGIEDDIAQRYMAWRRSIFLLLAVLTGISALWSTIALIEKDVMPASAFGVLAKVVRLLSLYVMPAAAIVAACFWSRLQRSRSIILYGWAVSFLVPIVIALFPMHLLVEYSPRNEDERRQAALGLGFIGAIWYYVLLMPTVLSLIPGVMRACLRLKTLLPESIITGWFMVAASPLYVLLWLVTFVTINQVAGNALLIFGLLLFMGAPLVYLCFAGLFIRPLKPEEAGKINLAQVISSGLFGTGCLLLLIYLFTKTIGDVHLIGFDSDTSIARPWKIFQFAIEYAGRSLFTSTLMADLFMLVNLSVWTRMRQFAKTETAENYDRLMGRMGDLLRGK